MKQFLFLFLVLSGISVAGQSTWADIHAIIQTNCAVSCHKASNPSGQLLLDGTSSQVYANLVNVTPVNPAASGLGDKRVKPGHPERSFLMRKLNNGWDPYYNLNPGEGNNMPSGQPSLASQDLEKIRQWILFGAPQTGVVVQDSTIQDFYAGEGLPMMSAPPAPPAGQGFQIRLGPFLMEPLSEVEYFKKHELVLADSIEINKVDIEMNPQSHHYIIYKFDPGAAASFPDGLRDPNTSPSGNSVTMVSAAQYSRSFVLPTGTAYFWEQTAVLDLNYHIQNLNSDSILAAVAWYNVWTQPKGTAQTEMYSTLLPFSNMTNPNIFFIPNNAQEKVFTDPFYLNGSNDEINIWLLSSHTHKWGTDYDIYKRNANGTKGNQLYEGFYDRDYTFNQGYYDWAHPAIREFDPLETVKLSEGIIQEARFKNFGNDTAYFGLTTDDEMMLILMQYTLNWTPSSPGFSENQGDGNIRLYPNPAADETNLSIRADHPGQVMAEIYDINGRLTGTLPSQKYASGNNQIRLDNTFFPSAGIYFIKVRTDETVETLRLIVEK